MKKRLFFSLISGALGVALGLFLKKGKIVYKEKVIVKKVPIQMNIIPKTAHKFPYESLSFSLQSPFFSMQNSRFIIRNNEMYVPLSFFKEYLNLFIYCRSERKEILIETTDRRIVMQINEKIATIDGNKIAILHEPILHNEEILVPFVEVLRLFGCGIQKNEEFNEVLIYF